MSDSDKLSESAPAESEADKKASQGKRREISKLRMHMKFIDGEIEKHQAARKALRAEMDALGGGAKARGTGRGAKKSAKSEPT